MTNVNPKQCDPIIDHGRDVAVSYARQKERNRIASRELRQWRKENGYCVMCGKEKSETGRTLCWQCRMWNNQRRSGYTGRTPRKTP